MKISRIKAKELHAGDTLSKKFDEGKVICYLHLKGPQVSVQLQNGDKLYFQTEDNVECIRYADSFEDEEPVDV